MPGQEVEHETSDLIDLLIECEVAGVNQMNLGIRQVPLVSFRARGDEGGIITAPDNQRRWLVFAQPRLPGGVGGDVGAIIVEQICLDFPLSGPGQESVFVGPGVGVVALGIRAVGDMPLPGAFERGESVDLFRMRVPIRPILSDPGPLDAKSLLVGVRVLDNERADPLGVSDLAQVRRGGLTSEVRRREVVRFMHSSRTGEVAVS